jgi:probable HAF family extracellular repeat protein/surface protein
MTTPLTDATFQTAINNWFTLGSAHDSVVNTYGQMTNWNVSQVTNMNLAFYNRTSSGTGAGLRFTGLQPNESVSNWNTANVTDMGGMFSRAYYFEGNLTKNGNIWNTAKVQNFESMFYIKFFLGTGIDTWDTRAATNMRYMFYMCTYFNQNLTYNSVTRVWDTRLVTNFTSMFQECNSFSGAGVATWDTRAATNMRNMFFKCYNFNQNLTYNSVTRVWDTRLVTDFTSMFQECVRFSGAGVATWNIASTSILTNIFNSTPVPSSEYNAIIWIAWSSAPNSFSSSKLYGIGLIRPLTNATFQTAINDWFTLGAVHDNVVNTYGQMTNWDVSQVTNMSLAFYNKTSSGTGAGLYFTGLQPNESVSNWNTANVTDMGGMFSTTLFIGDLTRNGNIWNTAKVQNFSNMFYRNNGPSGSTPANGVNTWDTRAATNMAFMFYESFNFNQNLTYNSVTRVWDTRLVTNFTNMFKDTFSFLGAGVETWILISDANINTMFNNSLVRVGNNAIIWNAWSKAPNSFSTTKLLSANLIPVLTDATFQTAINDWFTLGSAHDSVVNTYGQMTNWDVSQVTNMSNAFLNRTSSGTGAGLQFTGLQPNESVSNWNTANVTTMQRMFDSTYYFNGTLTKNGDIWNTAKVSNFSRMFISNTTISAFQGNGVNTWDTRAATNTYAMFWNAVNFNANLQYDPVTRVWDTRLVTDMSYMFESTEIFLGAGLSTWLLSSTLYFTGMFRGGPDWSRVPIGPYNAIIWNAWSQAPNSFSVAQLIDAELTPVLTDATFQTAINDWFTLGTAHDNVVNTYGQMTNWDVSQVTNMSNAFYGRQDSAIVPGIGFFASVQIPNESVEYWNTANVTNMSNMFTNARYIRCNLTRNGNIWNTGKVQNFSATFASSGFSGNGVNTWDTHSATNMSNMFNGCITLSNQNLVYDGLTSVWDTRLVTDTINMFTNTYSFFGAGVSTWHLSNTASIDQMFGGGSGVRTGPNNKLIWNTWSSAPNSFSTAQLTNANLISPLTDATFQPAINNWFTLGAAHDTVVNTYGQMTDWDVSQVTNMSEAFLERINSGTGAGFFTGLQENESVSNWNTANVTNMADMFNYASYFNGDLTYNSLNDAWNTAKVTNMSNMFFLASAFQGNGISTWDTHAVLNMSSMFANAANFNTTLTKSGNIWNTGAVLNMNSMFNNATNFVGNGLGTWNTSAVTNMGSMFANATSFLGNNINNWLVSNTSDISSMFYISGITPANNDLIWRAWSLAPNSFSSNQLLAARLTTPTNIPLTNSTFQTAINNWFVGGSQRDSVIAYYGQMSEWNVSQVTNMSNAFKDNSGFTGLDPNEILSNWNTANVTNMTNMFQNAANFNGNLTYDPLTNGWNTANVTSMSAMFNGALSFNANGISNWLLSNTTEISVMFTNSGLITTTNNLIWRRWSSAPNSFSSNQLLAAGLSVPQYTPLTDSTFQTAINDWFTLGAAHESVINNYGQMSDWNTSQVTNMANAFYQRSNSGTGVGLRFTGLQTNESVSSWNTVNVTNMRNMFYGAAYFNGDLTKNVSSWNTENVQNFSNMFLNASEFQGTGVNTWYTQRATNMSGMFANALVFNQALPYDGSTNVWYTPLVNNSITMFYGATSFLGNGIASWRLSNTTSIDEMFGGSGVPTAQYNATIWNTWSILPNSFSSPQLLGANLISPVKTPLTDTTFQTAINDWFLGNASKDAVISNYGEMADWNVSQVTNMSNAFSNRTLTGLVSSENLANWNTSNVTNMASMFQDAPNFNGDLTYNSLTDAWSTHKVTNMSSMFYMTANNSAFQGTGLSTWDTHAVTDMTSMFAGASNFNANLTTAGDIWNTSAVTNMRYMFYNAISFVGTGLGTWNTSFVTSMLYMFGGTSSFLGDGIKNWLISNTTDIENMFYISGITTANNDLIWRAWSLAPNSFTTAQLLGARLTTPEKIPLTNSTFQTAINDWFSGPPTKDVVIANYGQMTFWDVSQVTNMSNAFNSAPLTGLDANESVSNWNTANVTTMAGMFKSAVNFNGDLTYNNATNAWNTGNVQDMTDMFNTGTAFEGTGLNTWDTHSLLLMPTMFSNALNFNQDLTSWDTSYVTDATSIFEYAQNFIGAGVESWSLISATSITDMFTYSGVPTGPCNDVIWSVWRGPPNNFTREQLLSTGLTLYLEPLTNTTFQPAINDWFTPGAAHDAVVYTYGQMSDWNTTQVTNMSFAFEGRTSSGIDGNFTGNQTYETVSNWNTKLVVNMTGMFQNATYFNGDLSAWLTSFRLTNVSYMFDNATNFQGIGLLNWRPSLVTNMSYMFNNATLFQEDLSSWGTRLTRVTNMDFMFHNAISFLGFGLQTWTINQPPRTTTIARMFLNSGVPANFDQTQNDLIYNAWKTSNNYTDATLVYAGLNNSQAVTIPFPNSLAFKNAIQDWFYGNRNQVISVYGTMTNWMTQNLTDMSSAFAEIPNFSGLSEDDPDAVIDDWDTSLVVNMSNMFDGASIFNGNIASWDVRAVENMSYMFNYALSFNNNLSSWASKVSNVTTMENMFYSAASFQGNGLPAWVLYVSTQPRVQRNLPRVQRNLTRSIEPKTVASVNILNMFTAAGLSPLNNNVIYNNWIGPPNNLIPNTLLGSGLTTPLIVIDLGTLPGGNVSAPINISFNGSVVIGYSNSQGNDITLGFWYANDVMHEVFPLPGDDYTYIVSVSDYGTILCGFSVNNTSLITTAIMCYNGRTIKLDTSDPPFYNYSLSTEISGDGRWIIGYGLINGSSFLHFFRYDVVSKVLHDIYQNGNDFNYSAINVNGDYSAVIDNPVIYIFYQNTLQHTITDLPDAKTIFLSADGSFLVATNNIESYVYTITVTSVTRYQLPGWMGYTANIASGISRDMQTIICVSIDSTVGYCTTIVNDGSVTWDYATLNNLGAFGENTFCFPSACSSDGSIVVGRTYDNIFSSNTIGSFVSSFGGPVENLYPEINYFTGISGDGLIFTGVGPSGSYEHAFITRELNPFAYNIGTLPGDYNSGALGISLNGEVVYGFSYDIAFHYFWYANYEMNILNPLPGDDAVTMFARYVLSINELIPGSGNVEGDGYLGPIISDDGRTIVGASINNATITSIITSVKFVNGVTISLDPYKYFLNSEKTVISGNGQVIAGVGEDKDGKTHFVLYKNNTLYDLGTSSANFVFGEMLPAGISVDGETIIWLSRSNGSFMLYRNKRMIFFNTNTILSIILSPAGDYFVATALDPAAPANIINVLVSTVTENFAILPSLPGTTKNYATTFSRDGTTIFAISYPTDIDDSGNAIAITSVNSIFTVTNLGTLEVGAQSSPVASSIDATILTGNINNQARTFVSLNGNPVENLYPFFELVNGISGDGQIIIGQGPVDDVVNVNALLTRETYPYTFVPSTNAVVLNIQYTFPILLESWTDAYTVEVITQTSSVLQLLPNQMDVISVLDSTSGLETVVTVAIVLLTNSQDATAVTLLQKGQLLFPYGSPLNLNFRITIIGFYGLFQLPNWLKTPNSGSIDTVTDAPNSATMVSGDADIADSTILSITAPYSCYINFHFTSTTNDENFLYDSFGFSINNGDPIILTNDSLNRQTDFSPFINLQLGDIFRFLAITLDGTLDGTFGPVTTNINWFTYTVSFIPNGESPTPVPTPTPCYNTGCPPPIFSKPNGRYGGNVNLTTVSNTNALRYAALVQQGVAHKGKLVYVTQNAPAVNPPRNRF